jgi:hypothetical protein
MGTYKSSKKQVKRYKRYKRSYRKKIKKSRKKSRKKTRKSVKRIKRSYLRNSKKKENKQKGGGSAEAEEAEKMRRINEILATYSKQQIESIIKFLPQLCINCYKGQKDEGSNFCGDKCKGDYLDANLECLTCDHKPMGTLSGGRYKIDNLFCQQCIYKGKHMSWKNDAVQRLGMFKEKWPIFFLEKKGWTSNITEEVTDAKNRYLTWFAK